MSTTANRIAMIEAEIADLEAAKRTLWDELTDAEIDGINNTLETLRATRRACYRVR